MTILLGDTYKSIYHVFEKTFDRFIIDLVYI